MAVRARDYVVRVALRSSMVSPAQPCNAMVMSTPVISPRFPVPFLVYDRLGIYLPAFRCYRSLWCAGLVLQFCHKPFILFFQTMYRFSGSFSLFLSSHVPVQAGSMMLHLNQRCFNLSGTPTRLCSSRASVMLSCCNAVMF